MTDGFPKAFTPFSLHEQSVFQTHMPVNEFLWVLNLLSSEVSLAHVPAKESVGPKQF